MTMKLITKLFFGLIVTGVTIQFVADKRFTIDPPFDLTKMRENWNFYPDNIKSGKRRGIQITSLKKEEYKISGMSYIHPIELSSKWEMDVELILGKSKPMRGAEMKGEDVNHMADTFAMHFSSHVIPAEAIGPEKNAIPVQGGVFLFLRGKKKSYIVFKHFSKYSGLTQRYMDLVYENAENHTADLKHFSCEFKSKDTKSVTLSLRANIQKKTMGVYYQRKYDSKFKKCFKINHIDRYIDLHFHFLTMFAMTPSGRNSNMWLARAFLDQKKPGLGPWTKDRGKYDKKLFEDINSRINTLSEMENFPKKKVGNVLLLEEMIKKRAKMVEKYAVDFHQGLQELQEFFIHGVNKNKKRNVNEVSALKKIHTKLVNLERRQAVIYKKFVEMHNSVGKQRNLKMVKQKFTMMEKQIDSIANNMDQTTLEKLISKSRKLINLFEKISSKDLAWDKLMSFKDYDSIESHHSFLYYGIMFGGLTIIVVLVINIIGKIRKSQKSHLL